MFNDQKTTAGSPTHRVSATARHLIARIDRSLTKRNTPQRRKFWLGYILALLQYHVITMSDYRWLRSKTASNYGD